MITYNCYTSQPSGDHILQVNSVFTVINCSHIMFMSSCKYIPTLLFCLVIVLTILVIFMFCITSPCVLLIHIVLAISVLFDSDNCIPLRPLCNAVVLIIRVSF